MSQTTNTGQAKAGPKVEILRSQLGRARGLGAARAGTATWWAERLTSIALLPLTFWFVFAVLHLAGRPRADIGHFLASPINAALMLATVLITFHHTHLGLQVVIEDYIHRERTRLASLLAIRGLAFFLALACSVAVLKLAFTG